MNRIVVLAHTRHQVERFASKNYLRRSDILYASRPNALDGISNCVVIYLSGWIAHHECVRIDERVQIVRSGYGIERLTMADDTFVLYGVVTGTLRTPEGTDPSYATDTMRWFTSLLLDRYRSSLQNLQKD